MKNPLKSKQLLSIFVDFLFIVVIVSIVFGIFFTVKAVLYPKENGSGKITVRTELMPTEFENSLSVGDSVFDTLTKRRVGEIAALEKLQREDKIFFLLTINASFIPRSKALRTENLWFYYAMEDI